MAAALLITAVTAIASAGGWSEDFPKGDRQFVEGTQRLTRLKARPTEEVIEPDTDDMYDYPWLYAVNVGTWVFSDAQAQRLREYLLRGGFMVVDSFHGEADWASLHERNERDSAQMPSGRSWTTKTRFFTSSTI